MCAAACNANDEHMHDENAKPERFVDADEAGRFLGLRRARVLELARRGFLPGHPILGGGQQRRRVWRFRLSELSVALTQASAETEKSFRSPAVAVKGVAARFQRPER